MDTTPGTPNLTTRHAVTFSLVVDGYEGSIRKIVVSLTEGYTTREDIPTIIALRYGRIGQETKVLVHEVEDLT